MYLFQRLILYKYLFNSPSNADGAANSNTDTGCSTDYLEVIIAKRYYEKERKKNLVQIPNAVAAPVPTNPATVGVTRLCGRSFDSTAGQNANSNSVCSK